MREVLRLVPDEFDGFVQDISYGVKRVVVAIGPRKDDDSEFHRVLAPYGIRGTPILAQPDDFKLKTKGKNEDQEESAMETARREKRIHQKATAIPSARKLRKVAAWASPKPALAAPGRRYRGRER